MSTDTNSIKSASIYSGSGKSAGSKSSAKVSQTLSSVKSASSKQSSSSKKKTSFVTSVKSPRRSLSLAPPAPAVNQQQQQQQFNGPLLRRVTYIRRPMCYPYGGVNPYCYPSPYGSGYCVGGYPTPSICPPISCMPPSSYYVVETSCPVGINSGAQQFKWNNNDLNLIGPSNNYNNNNNNMNSLDYNNNNNNSTDQQLREREQSLIEREQELDRRYREHKRRVSEVEEADKGGRKSTDKAEKKKAKEKKGKDEIMKKYLESIPEEDETEKKHKKKGKKKSKDKKSKSKKDKKKKQEKEEEKKANDSEEEVRSVFAAAAGQGRQGQFEPAVEMGKSADGTTSPKSTGSVTLVKYPEEEKNANPTEPELPSEQIDKDKGDKDKGNEAKPDTPVEKLKGSKGSIAESSIAEPDWKNIASSYRKSIGAPLSANAPEPKEQKPNDVTVNFILPPQNFYNNQSASTNALSPEDTAKLEKKETKLTK